MPVISTVAWCASSTTGTFPLIRIRSRFLAAWDYELRRCPLLRYATYSWQTSKHWVPYIYYFFYDEFHVVWRWLFNRDITIVYVQSFRCFNSKSKECLKDCLPDPREIFLQMPLVGRNTKPLSASSYKESRKKEKKKGTTTWSLGPGQTQQQLLASINCPSKSLCFTLTSCVKKT